MILLVHGIVLNSQDLAEFDKRITLYTQELGKIRAKVVGVKKTVSKLRSLTIPFTEAKFQVYLHGTKRSGPHDPGKIIGGEAVAYHSRLRENWEPMLQGSAVCEILDVLTHAGYPNPQEYRLLALTLNQLEATSNPILVRCRFVLGLLKILGYSLLYHSVWKSYSDFERGLVNRLAGWNVQDKLFSTEDELILERLTRQYLARYLPYSLKTDIFVQKVESKVFA